MATVIPIDYISENQEIQPSMFRHSELFNLLMECIFKPYEDQQEQLIWLKDNILNLDAAEMWHLDFLGNLVGQSRFLVSFNVEPYFGFDGSYQSDTFGTVNDPSIGGYWYSYNSYDKSTARRLNDDEYRRVIKARLIYIHSNCISNDLIEVINLLTDTKTARIQKPEHGVIEIEAIDTSGLLTYFMDRVDLQDNILPIAAGVSVRLIENV